MQRIVLSRWLVYAVFAWMFTDAAHLSARNHSATSDLADITRATPCEAVFIDAAVPNLSTLINGIRPGVSVFVLNPNSDGVEQIAELISTRHLHDLSAIQLVSHGLEGEVRLGSITLTHAALAAHASALTVIGKSLARGGDIILYGCYVGHGSAGWQFLNDLANATGADVAASSSPVGMTSSGPNWALDVSTGPIKAANPFSMDALAAYAGQLPAALNGQFYYTGLNGTAADAGIFVINSDLTSQSKINAAITESMAVDSAAGLIFTTSGLDGVTVRHLSDGSVISLTRFGPQTGNANFDDAVEAVAVDPISHKLYVGDWGSDNNSTGIRVFTYNPSNGALTAQASNGGFLFTAAQTETSPGNDATTQFTSPWHFSLDVGNQKLYYGDNDNGYAIAPYRPVNSVYVVDLLAATPLPQLLTTLPSGSATGGSGGGGLDAVYTKGLIGQIVVDPPHNLVYFATSQSQPVASGGPNHSYDSIYYVSATPTGASQTATKVTLIGFPASFVNGFFPFESGTLVIDPTLDQIYIDDQNHDGVNPDPSSYTVAQVSADGHTFTFVRTISISTLMGHTVSDPNNGELNDTAGNGFFNPLPVLTITGTATHATEQSAGWLDLTASNTSSDHYNGYYTGATVQITGGTFSSNETSANDDHLSVLDGATHRTSGLFTGTSITVSYNSATEKLTLSGYDTIANYNTVLGLVQYQATGDNPGNYGNNNTRTVSWTVSDGASNVPFGAQNSATTTLTIDAVNDSPVNTVPGSQTATEDTSKSIAGLSVSDVDANAASDVITMTLAVAHGGVTIRTDVVSGLTAGGVSGNGSASVTLTGTQNAINTTLAAANSVVYLGSANFYGSETLTVTANDQGHTGTSGALQDQDIVAITVNGVADTPSVTNATTGEDIQTSSGLVVTRNLMDGAEVTHFKITGITGGTLFKNDGTTVIANNAFITFAEANAGLKFTPNANVFTPGTSFGFNVQASISALDSGLGGSVVPATITVNPVADTPSVTGATTSEDTQAPSGLVISRNAVDGTEVTHFKITGITGGNLFKNDGSSLINNGDFITYAEGHAGLKFTPAANLYTPVSSFNFQVQGATDSIGAGLGSAATASITVNPVADTPSVSSAVTPEDTQTSSGLVINRNAVDGAEVTYFKITGITGGTLFQNDGATVINNGDFITYAEGHAGLKYTPAASLHSPGSSFSFQAQASLSASDAGLGGNVASGNITVNAVADTPSVSSATTTEALQTTSGLVITRNVSDGSEVTNYKITGIIGGTLFQNDGTTIINNGDFITVAQGLAGLKFTPTAGLYTPGTTFEFKAQASLSGSDSGLGGGLATGSITVNPNFDFGDAPDPTYPTLLAHDGARHVVLSTGATIYLGSIPPDTEPDASQNANASGDDSAGTADEDGVALPAFLTGGQTESVTVVASGAGFLNAWIDFNQNGDWSDAGEQIFTDTPVIAGPNTLHFTVPAGSISGASFARFRLTSYDTGGTLSFVGMATDGEVEDYQVHFNAPPAPGTDNTLRSPNLPLKIAVADLLSNDTDADADTLSLTSVASLSANNAAVSRSGGWVFYDPPNGFNSSDSFTYSVSDGRGGTATGTVNVTVSVDDAQGKNELTVQDLGGGIFRLTFNGIPDRTYTVQYTTQLNTPPTPTIWQSLGPATVNGAGQGTYDDTSGSSSRFYRTSDQ